MNAREKGLTRVREVRKILEGMEHQVEGPGYSVAFFGGRMQPIHRDYFSVADLISYFGGKFILHQVTDLKNKSKHVRVIQDKRLPCWIWCRAKEGGKVFYRVFLVDSEGTLEEGLIQWRV